MRQQVCFRSLQAISLCLAFANAGLGQDGPFTFHNPGVGGKSGRSADGLVIEYKVPNGYDPRRLSSRDIAALPSSFATNLVSRGQQPGSPVQPYSLDLLVIQNHPIVHGVRLYLSQPGSPDTANPFSEFLLDEQDRLKIYLGELSADNQRYTMVDETQPQIILGSTYFESMDISNYMPPLPANDKNAWIFKALGGYWEGDLSSGQIAFRLDDGRKESLKIARIDIYRVRGQGHPAERERFDRSIMIPPSKELLGVQLCDRKCKAVPADFDQFDFRTVLK